MRSKRFPIVVAMTCLSFMASGAAFAQFVHPGCLSTQADLDRMAAKVAAGTQPWKGSWDILVGNTSGWTNHTPEAVATINAGGGGPDNYIRLARDCARAYQLALRFHGDGSTWAANKSVQIMNAWASTHTAWTGDTNVSLRAGLYGHQFACAAELMRGYSGWDSTDFAAFQQYMQDRYVPLNKDFLYRKHGTMPEHYWSNWTQANVASVIAIGVLCDDQALFDLGVDYFLGNAIPQNGSGTENINNSVHFRHPNGLGQWQESGRDQGHCLMGPQLTGVNCEIAWNQGIDLYGHNNNLFLSSVEYISKYNVWQEVPWVTYCYIHGHPTGTKVWVQNTISSSGRGQRRPGWDLVYNHYVHRMGHAAPWTAEFAEQTRPEGGGFNNGGNSGGFDGLGFTTLTHSRDPIASGAVPANLVPHVKGRRITLSWRGSAHATTYNVKRATASGGPYTTLATVDRKSLSHVDPGLTAGTSYYYVVSANNPDGESANSTEAAATATGELFGTIIGTDGSWNNTGATKGSVFDGSLKNYFDAPDSVAWAGLDLGADVSAVITQVSYCPRANFGGRMVGGKFQGSNTADFSSGVVDLFTISAGPPNGVLTTQSVSNGNSFRYVRYLGPSNGYGNVAEVRFIGNVTGMIPPASPPDGLTVSSPDPGQAAIAWNAVSGASDYVIKRATTSGGPYTIVDTVTGTAYTERGLPAGNYHYVVSALNSAGETAGSAEQSVQLLVNAAPGSQTSAHSGSGSGTEGSDKAVDGNVNTKWYAGTNSGSSGWLQVDLGAGNAQVVVRYDLTSANDVPDRDPQDWQLLGSNDAANWTTLDTRADEVFATRFLTRQFPFTNSTAYRYYKLNILSNVSGNSIQLAEWALMSQGAGVSPPAEPTGLAATAVAGSGIELSWSAAAGADGYSVKRATISDGPFSTVATSVTATSYSDSGLSASTTYYYVASAMNAGGESASSAPVPATTFSTIEEWRLANFGSTANTGDAADIADPDGDGWKNGQEFVSGTDPNDRASLLKMSQMQASGDDMLLTFPTVGGKNYHLERSDTLLDGSWATVQENIAGTGGDVQIIDAGGATRTKRFYRISVGP